VKRLDDGKGGGEKEPSIENVVSVIGPSGNEIQDMKRGLGERKKER